MNNKSIVVVCVVAAITVILLGILVWSSYDRVDRVRINEEVEGREVYVVGEGRIVEENGTISYNGTLEPAYKEESNGVGAIIFLVVIISLMIIWIGGALCLEWRF